MILFLFIFVNECKIIHLPKIIDVYVMSAEIPAEIRGQYLLMNSTIYRKGWVIGVWSHPRWSLVTRVVTNYWSPRSRAKFAQKIEILGQHSWLIEDIFFNL